MCAELSFLKSRLNVRTYTVHQFVFGHRLAFGISAMISLSWKLELGNKASSPDSQNK